MTLVKLIGDSIGLSQIDFRGLEERMDLGWLKRKITGADIKFDPNKRKNMKGIAAATAAIALGGVGGILGTAKISEASNAYRDDLPSAVAYANNNALENAYLAIRFKTYHQKVHAIHGITREDLIQVSLGLTNENINNLPVVGYGEKVASPLYFLLRARMGGSANDIRGSELRRIIEVNPTAEQFILGVNAWYNNSTPEKGKLHFANGIFEIAELNQDDVNKINSRFNYSFVCQHPHQFSEPFSNLPIEQKNWILDNIIWNKIKRGVNKPIDKFDPSDKNKKWENFFWNLGFYSLIEYYDGINNNEIEKQFNEQSLYEKLAKIMGYHTLTNKLTHNN